MEDVSLPACLPSPPPPAGTPNGVTNGILAGVPGHPLWQAAIDMIAKNAERTPKMTSSSQAGMTGAQRWEGKGRHRLTGSASFRKQGFPQPNPPLQGRR